MFFVSATRLRVRSLFYLLGFFRANEASVKELMKTEGFKSGKELVDKGLTFWTLTLWESEAAMKTFRNSRPHRKAMQNLPVWCIEAAYMHWTQEDEKLPDWETLHKMIVAEGKLTKVRKPSQQQLAKDYPPVKWKKSERIFRASPVKEKNKQ